MMAAISNTVVPGLLQSAQSALQGGSALMDTAATKIVGATLNTPAATLSPGLNAALTNPPVDSPTSDPLMRGLLDSIRAQTQVEAGAALVHVYDRTNDDLLNMLWNGDRTNARTGESRNDP